ncbi:MAG TPA: hypothetical protein VIL49_00580 [Capillimicrobium sp.]
MIAHVGIVPVEELLALALGGGTAWAAGAAWLRASVARRRR